MTTTPSLHVPLEGPSPEGVIARDLVKRALPVAPVLLMVCGLIWGVDGALSSAYGLVLVLANFLLAAALLAGAARISIAFMMVAALAGFAVRLALIFAAVWLVVDFSWVEVIPLGITIIVSHIGLLVWEIRYVSASLAYPTLKPSASSRAGRSAPER